MPPSSRDDLLRQHLLELLDGGSAHLTLDDALADVPPSLRASLVSPLEHNLWQLLEHIRICQWDILRFTIDRSHVSPSFPDGYWPPSSSPPDDHAWDASLASLRRDFQSFRALVADPSSDLFSPIPGGTGQTLAREAMLLANHNSYHLGQFVSLRRLLHNWPPASRPCFPTPSPTGRGCPQGR